MWEFPLFPEQASTSAEQVDRVYLALVLFATAVTLLVATLVVVFSVYYRSGKSVDRMIRHPSGYKLELFWIVVLTSIGMTFFVWSGWVFIDMYRPPAEAMRIFVVGKQWMWKIQHPDGKREINTLHVPAGRNVALVMTSQDVIHSFFIPAFRVKMDVVPGRYHTMWFRATKPGTYHLFCAEYCGADHSRMIGQVVVLEPREYERWLGASTGQTEAFAIPGSLAGPITTGTGPFFELGCNTCHIDGSDLRAPRLEGLMARTVRLSNGQAVIADEAYIRESILQPDAKIVAGYPSPSLMPAFQGRISEQQLDALVQYIRSLSPEAQQQGEQP